MQDERRYVVEAISAFLNGTGGAWDWRTFTVRALRDVELDRIRRAAAAIPLPLDAEGAALLHDLLEQADLVPGYEPTRPAPWSMTIGLMIGLLCGALLWWFAHLPGAGLLDDLHLLLLPAAAGALIVAWRNSRKQVGAYDPRIVEQNRRGRV